MKVVNVAGVASGAAEEARAVNRAACTRCGRPWRVLLVERVEIWRCGQCGYEARETSVDIGRAIEKHQESLTT